MFCSKCGNEVSEKFCNNCGNQVNMVQAPQEVITQQTPATASSKKSQASMPTTKLVFGIVAIIFSILVMFQSCSVSMLGSMSEALGNETDVATSGVAGMLLSACILIGGISGICTRKVRSGSVITGCIFVFGAIVAFGNVGDFADLQVWASLSAFIGVLFILSGIFVKKSKP